MKSKQIKKSVLYLTIPSLLVVCVATEIALRKIYGDSLPFATGLAELNAEHFYFHTLPPGTIPEPGEERFDPELSWRAGALGKRGQKNNKFNPKLIETVNTDGFRGPREFSTEKKKIRVALLGDSFTYGFDLGDEESVGEHLQKMLGDSYEVMNFAQVGYGVDQMTTVATRILPKYAPDYVILAFIGDDLYRSCVNFAGGRLLKPRYVAVGDTVEPQLPIRSPTENLKYHQQTWNRIEDAVLGRLTSVRLLSILSEPYFAFSKRLCVTKLNIKLLEKVYKTWDPKAHVLFVHLFRDLHPEFIAKMEERKFPFLRLANNEKPFADRLGVQFGTNDGYHPNSDGAKVHARAYADFILAHPLKGQRTASLKSN